MSAIEPKSSDYLSQKSRLAALALYILLLVLVCKLVTGEWFPMDSGKRLWLLSGIALWFFVLISAPWFRPPRDSLANAATSGLLLAFLDFQGIGLFKEELNIFRWASVGLVSIVAITAVAAMMLQEANPVLKRHYAHFSRLSYRTSDALGKGEIIFTPPALISIIGYYQFAPIQQLWLLFIWTLLITVRPVELAFRLIAQFLNAGKNTLEAEIIGTISRVDNPNIVRVTLEPGAKWEPGEVAIACLPNSDQVFVLPLFNHVQESQLVGTGLYHSSPDTPIPDALPGYVYRTTSSVGGSAIVNSLSGLEGGAELIGFVVEDSNIAAIKFEVSPHIALEEGMLVFCRQNGRVIYYQILDARTTEESFERNPRGKHLAIASQLGCLDTKGRFLKYGWLPMMNAPVFIPKEPISIDITRPESDDFEIGKIPNTGIGVIAGFFDMLEFHSAILGVTGTGKTELALDIIKKGLELNTKIFCVDFTGEYRARLADFNPQYLGLAEEQAEELNQKLFAVETGEYGAPKEKGALKEFIDEIREPVKNRVDDFLSADDETLGIFELPEITNTKATLRATELYLSNIMDWARRHRRARRILIVLEEAHTIIPETIGSGFDRDTEWVVARIAQIALQGRKFGVGLLIISQRTALVSKSILSQCNTYIAFSLVDKTSLDYLGNVFTTDHIKSIPNLRFLEAIGFGKAIRSERPVLIKLEYDQSKKDASETLSRKLTKEDEKKSVNLEDLIEDAEVE
jgi:hypothetical protein